MKTYFKILSFARPLRNFIPRYLLLSMLGILFGIFNFTLLIPLLNIIFDTVEVDPAGYALPDFSFRPAYFKAAFNHYFHNILAAYGKSGALQFVCAVVLLSVLMSNVFRYWSQRVLTGMRTMVVMKLRQRVFDHLVGLHVRYFNSQRKGNLISVLSNDVTEIENSVVSSIQTLFREPLLLIGYVVLLFSISVELTFFSFLVLPVSGFVIGSISKKLRRASVKGQQQLGNLLSVVEESIGGIRIIKAFNAQQRVKQQFQQENSA